MTASRILIVNQNWLGDVLCSTPAIRAIRKKFPEAHLACLVALRCREVLADNPHLNEVIGYDDRVSPFSPLRFFSTVLQIRARRFDRVVFLHRSKTKAWIALLAGVRERVGYARPFRRKLLTRVFAEPVGPLHKIDVFLHLINEWGVPPDGRELDFVVPPEGEKE